MTHMEVHYTMKELISLIYIDSNMGNMAIKGEGQW